MRVVAVSVTESGRALAERLPYERSHGAAGATVRGLWGEVDGLVLMLATGAAVRIVAPLLAGKERDPAVVCVDEAGRFAVALCGGHGGGANDLARDVASLLGATPVVTTASDAAGLAALDALPGLAAVGDVAGVTTAILDGRPPVVTCELGGWPPPARLVAGGGPEQVVVTDRRVPPSPGTVALHPPSLVAGVGCSSDAGAEEAAWTLAAALGAAGLAPESVGTVATIDRRAEHPAVLGLGRPVRAYAADELARVPVADPSPVVERAVGTPSVAEAAALLAAGPDGTIVVGKQRSPRVTIAVARCARRPGHLALVGLGPGGAAHRTPAAAAAVRSADLVIGYTAYLEQAADLLSGAQEIVGSPIGDEVVRAKHALRQAAAGRRVALVCSGDAGIYAMASIVFELADAAAPGTAIEVVPGVTAALAASALLGAPLGHDHVLISLSDLLTPWTVIEARVRAAAVSDLVVAFYNPRSRGRSWQLEAALQILRVERPGTTPIGIVTDAGRAGQRVRLASLDELDAAEVGMTTCVIVGSSATRVVAGRMVTPRGYEP